MNVKTGEVVTREEVQAKSEDDRADYVELPTNMPVRVANRLKLMSAVDRARIIASYADKLKTQLRNNDGRANVVKERNRKLAKMARKARRKNRA